MYNFKKGDICTIITHNRYIFKVLKSTAKRLDVDGDYVINDKLNVNDFEAAWSSGYNCRLATFEEVELFNRLTGSKFETQYKLF